MRWAFGACFVVRTVKPDDVVVWYDLAYAQSCPSGGFFCSDKHFEQWLAARALPRPDFRLTLGEVVEVGRAIFAPALATAWINLSANFYGGGFLN